MKNILKRKKNRVEINNKREESNFTIAFGLIKSAERILREELKRFFNDKRCVRLDINVGEMDGKLHIISTLYLEIGNSDSFETNRYFHWFSDQSLDELKNELNIFIKTAMDVNDVVKHDYKEQLKNYKLRKR